MFKNRAEKEAFFKKFDEEQKRAGKIKQVEKTTSPAVVDKKKPQVKEPIKMGADYLGLIEVYRATHKTTYADAVRAINRIVPEAEKRASLERATLEKEAVNAPRSVATIDGKDFPEMVEDLKLNHGMTTIEAQRYIDRRWPGLRQGYIDQQNR